MGQGLRQTPEEGAGRNLRYPQKVDPDG